MTEDQSPSSAHDQAKIFRMVLEAMAHPGRIVDFIIPTINAPVGLSAEMAALLFTLCDFQTPLWMKFRSAEIEKFIKFHTGAPFTDVESAATFAILDAKEKLPSLVEFAQGTHEYPDRASTLLVQVETLINTGKVVLTGPGIADQTCLDAGNLSMTFWDDLKANHAQYPLGVDVIFVARRKIAAIPRSTHIEMRAQD